MAASRQQATAAAGASHSTGSSLLRELAEVVVLAAILYFGISFAVQAVHVEGLSMFATLDDNDYLIANKIDYRLHAPPSIRSRVMGPNDLESWVLLRLSPITKYSSGPIT